MVIWSPCDSYSMRESVKQRDEYGRNALIVASMNGHTETVKLLLERGADPNSANFNAMTALHEAALKDHNGVLALLIKAGGNVHRKNKNAQTPLAIGMARNAIWVKPFLTKTQLSRIK